MAMLALWVITLTSLISWVTCKSFIQSCNTASQCTSIVGYRALRAQKLQDVAALFNVDTVSLLGANNLDLTLADPENILIATNQIVKVPISCSCVNGIWRGNSTIYKVKAGDTLSAIADELFSGLVTFKQIAQANGIADPNKILVDSLLIIPFPCDCSNPVSNTIVLSYVVTMGDTVDAIVRDYNSVYTDFTSLNNINNASSDLVAGDVVAIPIHACLSSFRRSAFDNGLVVANGSYVITAGHCVQCSCMANLDQVYCTPAPATISGSCPDMRCSGSNLTVGSMSSVASVDGCNVTSCIYSGFKRRVILSSLQTVSLNSCPAPQPQPSYQVGRGSHAMPPVMPPTSSATQPGLIIPSTPSTQSTAFAPGPSSAIATNIVNSLNKFIFFALAVVVYTYYS